MVTTVKKIGFTVLLTVMGFFLANAQVSSPKVIALINKVSWCHMPGEWPTDGKEVDANAHAR